MLLDQLRGAKKLLWLAMRAFCDGKYPFFITSLPSCRVQNAVWMLLRRGRQLTPERFGYVHYQTALTGM